MMTRQGKRVVYAVAVSIFLGLFFWAGCDQEQTPAPLPAKPKVISKSIAPAVPEKPAGKISEVPASGDAVKPATALVELSASPSSGPGKTEGTDQGSAGEKAPPPAIPVTEEQARKENEQARSLASAPLFKSDQQYDSKGRVDPFIPLLTEKQAAPAVAAGDAPEEPKRMLTPLEKMDLSQIKLVAVIQTQSQTLAMVEEASGKGYEVRLGTYMGRNGGQVTGIQPDSLAVTEYYTDYQGKRRERVQEIKFHKNEGGE